MEVPEASTQSEPGPFVYPQAHVRHLEDGDTLFAGGSETSQRRDLKVSELVLFREQQWAVRKRRHDAYDITLTYRHVCDSEFTEQLCDHLTNSTRCVVGDGGRHLRVFLDRMDVDSSNNNNNNGRSFDEMIMHAIDNSSVVVAVISDESLEMMAKKHQANELDWLLVEWLVSLSVMRSMEGLGPSGQSFERSEPNSSHLKIQ